jgi:hypothetical protein
MKLAKELEDLKQEVKLILKTSQKFYHKTIDF